MRLCYRCLLHLLTNIEDIGIKYAKGAGIWQSACQNGASQAR